MDRGYLRAVFRIKLHIDDIEVLHTIKQFLKVGKVTFSGNSCLFMISDNYSLLNVLIPLLNKYYLYTTKWLDYLSFKSVVEFLSMESSRIPLEKVVWATALISDINLTRSSYNLTLIPTITVNPFWLLGFIEAEGTFGIKNLVPYFQIGQHTKNQMVLNAISAYLSQLPKGFLFTL